MGGGPSPEQQQAAASQANLTNQMSQVFGRQQGFAEKQQNLANPFFLSRMNQGLPYAANLTDIAGGTTARAFMPARQQLEQRLRQGANALPSGFAEGARSDLAADQARVFDQSLQGILGEQEQAKRFGAGGITGQQQLANPLGYGSGALQGNQSIFQAPLARPGLAGLLGGVAGGMASAIPF